MTEILFDKVRTHLKEYPDASPNSVTHAIGCRFNTTRAYLYMIHQGFSSPKEYYDSLQQKKSSQIAPEDIEKKVENHTSQLSPKSFTQINFSFPSLPTDIGLIYTTVEGKITAVLLESILQESTENPFAAISLSDIGRRASTNPKYIPFNEDYIPALLEFFVKEQIIEQELVTSNSGRTQPIYALNALQQQKIKEITKVIQTTISLEKKTKSYSTQEQEFTALFALGLQLTAIATELNLTKVNAQSYASRLGLFFKKGRGADYVDTIKQLLADDNLIDIYRRFSFSSPLTFYTYYHNHNLTLPENLTPLPIEKSLETLIEQGASLEEIGASRSKSHGWAQQYIKGSGWYTTWEKKRSQQTKKFQTNQQRETHFSLITLLSQKMIQLAKKDSWAMQKATEYFLNLNIRHHAIKPFSQYLTLFQAYEQAEQCSERLTLKELAIAAGFAPYPSSINQILKAVNVQPMFKSGERKTSRIKNQHESVTYHKPREPKLKIPKPLTDPKPKAPSQQMQKAQLNQAHSQLINLLSQRLVQQAQTQPWSTQKAVEYFNQLDKRQRGTKEFPFYLHFFQVYESAQKLGENLSINQLSRRAEISRGTIARIFQRAGIESLYNHKPKQTPRNRFEQKKKEALQRSIKIGLGIRDISYFLNLPVQQVDKYLSYRRDSSSSAIYKVHVSYIDNKSRKKEFDLPFADASEIFEAHDAGFSTQEIKELTRGSGDVQSRRHNYHSLFTIQYLLTSRPHIEPLLITLLQKLYNKPDLTKPYKISF